MEAFFTSIIFAIIIHVCSAIYYSHSNSSSWNGTTIAAVIVPLAIAFVVFIIIIVVCRIKSRNRSRMGIMPLGTQMAWARQENQYAPPSYNQAPPYGQLPVYEQAPPSYSVLGFNRETTKTTITS
jgi:hypothetical protein